MRDRNTRLPLLLLLGLLLLLLLLVMVMMLRSSMMREHGKGKPTSSRGTEEREGGDR